MRSIVPLIAVLLLAPAAAVPAALIPSAWDVLAPTPTARTEVAAAAAGGRIWVLGGLGAGANDGTRVEIYDPATNTWAQGPALPLPLHHTQVAVVGDFLLVLGGYVTNAFVPLPTVWILDTALPPAAQAWLPFAPLPEPRGAHGAATDGARVWIFGGIGPGGALDTAYRLDSVAGVPIPAWTPIADFPAPREHLAGGFLDGKVVAVGGRGGVVGANTGRMDVYDPATDAWTRGPSMPTPRGGIAAASAGGYLFVFGGEGPGGTFDEAEGYSAAANAWTAAPLMPSPRHGLGAATLDGAIYVESGGPVPGFTYGRANERLRLLGP